jgi:hypothetical protein
MVCPVVSMSFLGLHSVMEMFTSGKWIGGVYESSILVLGFVKVFINELGEVFGLSGVIVLS